MGKPEMAFTDFDEMKRGSTLKWKPSTSSSSSRAPAPLSGSTRLMLFVICLLATWNFAFQRFNINFGIVCMHRPLHYIQIADGSPLNFSFGHDTVIFQNVTNGEERTELESSSLIMTDLDNHPDSDILNNSREWSTQVPSEEHMGLEVKRIESRGCGSKHSLTDETNHSTAGHFLVEFDWSKDTKGGILASFYYGLTFSQIPGGWFVDRFGAKSALIVSQLFLSALSLVNPIAAKLGPEYMFVARLLQGVANGAAMPAINVLATRWCADMERSFLLGISYAGFGLATAVVYPISAFFCENLGWEWIFYFAGGTGLLWCVAAFFFIYEWPENHPRIKMAELQFIQKHRAVQYGGPKRQVVRAPWVSMLLSVPVWAMLVANFCCFWCFLTISAHLPTYLTEVMNLKISENGLLSAMPFVGMMSFHFLTAAMFDWLRKKKTCSVTALRKTFNTIGMFSSGMAVAALGLVACDNVISAVIAFTLCQTLLEFAFMGGYLFSIFELAPKHASSLTSLSNTVGLLSGLVSPALVSALTPDETREQWLLVFYITAGINAFGGFVYLFFGSCKLQPWATGGDGYASSVADGSSGGSSSLLSRSNSRRVEQELKQLKIRLINGESDVKGQTIKPSGV